ncbi:MAG TPA: alpha/beta fold hydrolase [Povalibacter sp.]|nr:alpha/beta fold hydrolase [Povalibacter sp.]
MYRFIVRYALLLLLLCVGSTGATDTTASLNGQTVVLLHGLARGADSMSKMAHALEAQGYQVCNIAYPSRDYPVEVLADRFVAPAIRVCTSGPDRTVHFVTHSLGGIVLRQLAATDPAIHIGRVVMLSPPNHGSEVVDRLGSLTLFELINGPAGNQLGTGEGSLPNRLGPADFDLGIITGTRSVNPILSLLIPGTDDGKVSTQRATLQGMKDFLLLPASHTFIMKNSRAIEQTLRFIRTGAFDHTATTA